MPAAAAPRQSAQNAQAAQQSQNARRSQSAQPAAFSPAPEQSQAAQAADRQKDAFLAPEHSGVEYLEAVQKSAPQHRGTPTPYWQE